MKNQQLKHMKKQVSRMIIKIPKQVGVSGEIEITPTVLRTLVACMTYYIKDIIHYKNVCIQEASIEAPDAKYINISAHLTPESIVSVVNQSLSYIRFMGWVPGVKSEDSQNYDLAGAKFWAILVAKEVPQAQIIYPSQEKEFTQQEIPLN